MSRHPVKDHAGGRPVVPRSGPLRPLGLGEVRITGGFWARRQRTNAEATLPHIAYWLERSGWIANFDPDRLNGAGDGSGHAGREFADSEIYKFMEAAAWEVARSGDPALDARLTALADRVAAAQDDDGYLNTAFGHPGRPPRYSDLEWGHELYCYGHLLQAAVARARTHGGDRLFEVARRVADHVCRTFGPAGIAGLCGHPVIETGLAEFARVTDEQRYLDQAALFVERRGHARLADIEYGRAYYQDDVPVRSATVLRGHAVRALYLASGAVDVATETGDTDLLRAVATQWQTTVARRTYLTGGMGAHHQDESFGDDFVLPPDRAYSETCAGVGSVMLSWRLLLASGDPKYADLIERALYNVIAASPALDGRSFFYANTLHQRRPVPGPDAGTPSRRAAAGSRAPWYEVACCPPNVARTLASLAAYVATADDEGVQLHQYITGGVATQLPDGRRVAFEVGSDYPYDGTVVIHVVGHEQRPWTLSLRIPAWADGARVIFRGEQRAVVPGVAAITESFRPGEEIRLTLPVAARLTAADPRIDAVRGCVAVEHGPLVLCAESADLPDGVELDAIRVDIDPGASDITPGAIETDAVAVVRAHRTAPADRPWPYPQPVGTNTHASEADSAVELPLIPYHAWANRGPSSMRVWLPT
ncbi:glycoside hydrolase family 127 protein [Jiangella asiatica]|uniref:Glycoside hydrolase family 127 protein n=1 Tax=Jiangella asiatica TaxID=2530372 RepID=A0A4R5D3U6_9ACTN|nr:beta-L-arabinofuranosidase domain-containing protein [Jiangella asiatica]TDE07916.1 glycoside hydrolase family 127 protein [Jiangella asiatica]